MSVVTEQIYGMTIGAAKTLKQARQSSQSSVGGILNPPTIVFFGVGVDEKDKKILVGINERLRQAIPGMPSTTTFTYQLDLRHPD